MRLQCSATMFLILNCGIRQIYLLTLRLGWNPQAFPGARVGAQRSRHGYVIMVSRSSLREREWKEWNSMCLGPPPKLTEHVRLNGKKWPAKVKTNKSDIQRIKYKLRNADVVLIPVSQPRWKHQEFTGSVPPPPHSQKLLFFSLISDLGFVIICKTCIFIYIEVGNICAPSWTVSSLKARDTSVTVLVNTQHLAQSLV